MGLLIIFFIRRKSVFGITATYEALLLLQTHGPIEDGAVSQNLVHSISKALPRFAVLFSLV